VQHETTGQPGWHDDPEHPEQLRYWDGSAWTEHRTDGAAGQPSKPVKEPNAPGTDEGGEPSFAVVVAGVLGGATLMIVGIMIVVIWVSSYNTGHSRGEQAKDLGISDKSASRYCEDLAKDTARPGSADGSWDLPWVLGCKRGIG
jgi:hypothetical protein